MKYISKGMVIRASTEDILFVTRCGVDFQLTGEQAALWLNGRFGFAKNRENVLEVKALQQLKRQGLVEITEGDEPVFEYGGKLRSASLQRDRAHHVRRPG